MNRIVWIVAAALMVAGCARHSDRPASTLTEHQRDSVLATEPIPGADVVGRALKTADREAGRAAAMDTLAR